MYYVVERSCCLYSVVVFFTVLLLLLLLSLQCGCCYSVIVVVFTVLLSLQCCCCCCCRCLWSWTSCMAWRERTTSGERRPDGSSLRRMWRRGRSAGASPTWPPCHSTACWSYAAAWRTVRGEGHPLLGGLPTTPRGFPFPSHFMSLEALVTSNCKIDHIRLNDITWLFTWYHFIMLL